MSSSLVRIRCRNVGKKVDPRTVRRRAERLLKCLELSDTELSIVLCNDTFIQILNRDYRNMDKPTDVLSFAMDEGEPLEGSIHLLGDIIISIDAAERQAPAVGHDLMSEITSLLIHGILHLVGYDHIEKADERRMQAEAIRLESLFRRHK